MKKSKPEAKVGKMNFVNKWNFPLNEEQFTKDNPKLAKAINKATVKIAKKCSKMTASEAMDYLNEMIKG